VSKLVIENAAIGERAEIPGIAMGSRVSSAGVTPQIFLWSRLVMATLRARFARMPNVQWVNIMNRRIAMTNIALLVVALTFALPATAQDPQSSLVGLWKVTSVANKLVPSGEVVHPFGEHPSGNQLFTRGGHTMFSMFGERRNASGQPNPADVDRVALFNALIAYTGTYTVDGSKVMVHFEASATPGMSDRTYSVEMSGNKLTLTSQPFTSGITGQRIITIRTFERVE
jgi:hypothetical protein